MSDLITTVYNAVYNFFVSFSNGEMSFSGKEYLEKPANNSWLLVMCVVGAAYIFLFILLPLFQWSHHLKGKPVFFRFWFAFITQVFFVVNAVFLLSLFKICNTLTLAAAIAAYAVVVRCHGRRKIIRDGIAERLDIYRRLAGGRYGFRLLVRNDGRIARKWVKNKLWAFLRHVGRHSLEYILLLIFLGANLWFYSYGLMHYNSYGFGDEYTHSQWIYQMTQGNIFVEGIYPFAMHCKIFAIHELFGIELHDVILYFGLMETMMMLCGIYGLIRTLSRRKYMGIIGIIFSSFASYVPILVIRRFQWSLPEECAIYLIFPTVIFLIRWLKDDVIPNPAIRTGPIKFVKSFFNRKIFTDNLILFAMSASMVIATHFYTAIIAIIFCVVICLVFLSKIIEENRIFPLMMAVVGAVCATVLPYVISLIQGNYFEASIEWAMNVAGTTASNGKSLSLYLMLLAVAGAAVLIVTLICWGLAQIRERKEKNKSLDTIITSGVGILLSVICVFLWRNAQKLGLLQFFTILRGNFVGKGLLGSKWGQYMIYISGALLVLSLLTMIFGRGMRARLSLSLLLTYFIIITLYCLPQLGFPQLMDQVRVSVFASVLTPVVITMTIDYLFDPPTPWFLDYVAAYIKKKKELHNAEKAQEYGISEKERRLLKIKKIAKTSWKVISEIDMAAVCVMIAAVLFISGQFHPLTEMEFTQYNAATECLRSIIREYDDYTWTLISPTDELYQSVQHGFHEETVTMVSELDRKSYYTIPSEYMFFFVEKNVIKYAQTLEFTKNNIVSNPVSYDEAMKPFVLSSSFTVNYTRNRLVVMSKMYYWAKAFAERYPNELKVYYEDDDFVCYMIRQNTYSLYNLDIDYGYRAE